MTCAFAVWTGVSANFAQTGSHSAAIAVVAMIFIYYMFYTIMHPLTYIFITEVFPFVHRAKGVGLTQVFSRAGSAFNQFVNPIGLGNIGWKFYIVYVVWLACETLIIWFVYPETKGPTLEELADCEFLPDMSSVTGIVLTSGQCLRMSTQSRRVTFRRQPRSRSRLSMLALRFDTCRVIFRLVWHHESAIVKLKIICILETEFILSISALHHEIPRSPQMPHTPSAPMKCTSMTHPAFHLRPAYVSTQASFGPYISTKVLVAQR